MKWVKAISWVLTAIAWVVLAALVAAQSPFPL